MRLITAALTLLMLAFPASVHASIAYGSIDNFDCVNDTGQECHGFEIECDDVRSRDITYTYDWNHYGTPRITEDLSDPAHPKVLIRYESGKKPDGSWAAYTAVPSGPISPTDGHQFTDPSVNFGGEHFGVGFYGMPSAVRYNWLVDDGTGNLTHGGVVNISTPAFTYYPPVANAPAQVQAAIVLPPPPVQPAREFGDPMWVKVTTTQSHNNNKVELRDLVSDDPEDPNDRNWKNGEPDEVEVEWQLMQTEFAADDGGANGQQVGAPEELPEGDEVITRRYDFYKYVGPIDAETGEAQTDNVGPDDLHGQGIKNIDGVDVDLSTVVVVGDYVGAQMAGFDPQGQIGLIDHLQDGQLYVPYVERTVVVGGTAPIETTINGILPTGMYFDVITGILSGTPEQTGTFAFTVHSVDAAGGDVSRDFTLTITDGPVIGTISTSASPAEYGWTYGDGEYNSGTIAAVGAVENPGYGFVSWTENGVVVSYAPYYEFVVDGSHNFVANFAPSGYVSTSASPAEGGWTSGDGNWGVGAIATVTAGANPGYRFDNWTEDGVVVSADANYTFEVAASRHLVANFTQAGSFTLTLLASPAQGGNTTGGGTYDMGTYVYLNATPNPGWLFVNWTWDGVEVTTDPHIEGNIDFDVTLVANFEQASVITTSASPAESGTTAGDGAYATGSSVTLTATANLGYHFVNWTEADVEVSAQPAYTFTAAGNRDLVANFAPDTYTIVTSSSPSAGGTTSGGGTVNSGTSVTLSAAPAVGYVFTGWSEGGALVSTSPSYTFTASADRNLVANFLATTYTITVSASPSIGGTATGGRTAGAGASVRVVAKANAGYRFVNWTEDGAPVATTASYTFTASANRNLVANFTPIVYTIKTTPSPSAGGTVTGAGTYNSGSSVTVVATPNANYAFVSWTQSGVVVSNSPTYTFTATANRSLVANFVRITYTVSTSASPSTGGTISGGGTVNSGATVRVIATAATGYQFVNWTEGGVVVSTTASYSFVAGGNRTLMANFLPKLASVQVLSPVVGGNGADGVVNLAVPAPAGGATVTLTSSKTATLTLPANVFVPEGSSSATFSASTSKVTRATAVTVTAALGASKVTTSVSVTK